MRVLVTGGLGFIGSNFVRYLRRERPADDVVVLDKGTYAANVKNLDGVDVRVEPIDVSDRDAVWRVFITALSGGSRFDAIVHLAAETHVDRSIRDAIPFLQANVLGTQVLLDVARRFDVEHFLLVSTDEVYGDLDGQDHGANEESPLRPSSPYAASKAAADLLALAAWRMHGLRACVTRCSNNYGPRQHPEKLIPHMTLRALAGEALPVYGDGRQVRDWVHVEDHCRALDLALRGGAAGEIYNIGAGEERENLSVAEEIVRIVGGGRVEHVPDRPGHDRRYALRATKAREALGWHPTRGFTEGLRETVAWYRENESWWRPILSGAYRDWVRVNYEKRA